MDEGVTLDEVRKALQTSARTGRLLQEGPTDVPTILEVVRMSLCFFQYESCDSFIRSGLNNLFTFSKLREARSRLYRRQNLQVNIRWKALDEIYKMYILLHRSDLKKEKIVQLFFSKMNMNLLKITKSITTFS